MLGDSYSNAVAMFCAYVTHPGYGWGKSCERTFGDIPSRICCEAEPFVFRRGELKPSA
jgi:hypothetical protein